MGNNELHSKEFCSIDIDQENKLEEILEPTPDCCIYRIPQFLRNINEAAYSPRLISVGPLHYGRKELHGMQSQKRRYLSTFGQRVKPEKLEELKTHIENQEQRIRAHYSVTSNLKSLEYVAMILSDAIFIIELLLRNYHETDDFLLKLPLKVSIRSDLLLLENQLPYFVLNDLYTKAFPRNEDCSFFDLLPKYFFEIKKFPFSLRKILQVKHFIDFYRCVIVETLPERENKDGHIYALPCATKLEKSGVKFRAIKKRHLLDINRKQYGKWFPWFEVNELQIPPITIHDSTETLFRNLMALEMFHYPTETHICHYASLMDHLIDTGKDVDLLVDKGIIVNCVGDNKAIAKMFNTLGSHIILSPNSCYNGIVEKMKAHYKYPWNHAKATLKNVYFGNYWAGTATVAATFLLILTVIQTVCSIMEL